MTWDGSGTLYLVPTGFKKGFYFLNGFIISFIRLSFKFFEHFLFNNSTMHIKLSLKLLFLFIFSTKHIGLSLKLLLLNYSTKHLRLIFKLFFQQARSFTRMDIE